jgi:hypothetical protein
MPSGFTLDKNQLTDGFYTIAVDLSSGTYYPTATSNTASGALWPYDWNNSSVYTNATTMTAAQALVLAQGNVRFNRVIEALSNVTDMRVIDVVVTASPNTSATAQPTALQITVDAGRDNFFLGNYSAILKAAGQAANGTWTAVDGSSQTAYNSLYAASATAVNTTALAIKDIVTGAIQAGGSTGYTRFWRVYNPAGLDDSQVKVTITQPNATNSNIYGTVTVTNIQYTTLAGSPV